MSVVDRTSSEFKAYLELYAPYLASHFALVRETPSWRIYARQDAAVPSG